MKKLCVIMALLTSNVAGQAQTPNWNEWFRQKKTQRKYLIQQIAALKVYRILKNGIRHRSTM